jgi:hypothetical protein
MLTITQGVEVSQESTRLGWPFMQCSGSVTVIGTFYIRGGSAIISVGTTRLTSWEDGLPGIRKVAMAEGLGVTVTTPTVMYIASPNPVVSIQLSGTGTVTSVSIPNILGQGGFMSMELERNGNKTLEDTPWFSFIGGIGTSGTGIIPNAIQLDPSLTRKTNFPNWGELFQSSNNTMNIGDPALLLQGVNLYGTADSRLRPFYHKVTIPLFSGFSDTIAMMFFEMPSVTANFTFSTVGSPATVVRGLFAPVPAFRNATADITINAQLYAPAWIPAAGNKVMAYVMHLAGAVIAPGFGTVHATGFAQLLKNTAVQPPLPVYIAQPGFVNPN